jgi:hypothetical protein
MPLTRRHLSLAAATFAAAIAAPRVHASTDAAALADRLLDALGGREAWARARTTRNDSQQNRSIEPAVVRAVITLDFTAPRFRIDTRGEGFAVARAVDGDRHWRRTRDGSVGPIPDDALADERRWYAAHVYRTLHRIAAGGGGGALQRPRAEQLDVIEGGARLAWYRVDSRGEPYAFGAHADEVGTVCGPWEFEAGGIRHPLWTARPDGTWRALLKALEVNVPMPAELLRSPG